VARKFFKVAKGLVGAPFSDHAIGVNKVVGHGKCGYPGNLGGNCCIAIKATNIC
jgi:hypothetical protein